MMMLNAVRPQWRRKLLEAADRSGRSDRDISLCAGVNPSYLNEMRRMGKDPSVPRALALANELRVSIASLFLDRDDISAEDEELLALSHQSTAAEREAVLTLWRRLHQSPADKE